ncbi:MAG: FG-GAP-like repeat-containing protein [bacterium]
MIDRRFPLAALVAALTLPGAAGAQNFVQITDPANPIVSATANGTYTGAAWVDVDDDGLLDLFICRKNQIYRNLGGGAFEGQAAAITQQANPIGTTWSDYDNDGDIDCYLSGGQSLLSAPGLHRNDGNFTFTKIVAPDGGDVGDVTNNTGWGCAFGDVNNDGYTDILVAAANNFLGVTHPNVLLLNNGDGTFTRDTSTPVTELLDAHTIPTFSDYDQDGDQDIFIGSGEISRLDPDNLFRNLFQENGSFGFERITTAPIATDSLDGQVWNWIDFDNDRDLDAFQTNYNFNLSNHLYRNDAGTYVSMTSSDVGGIVATQGAALGNLWMDFDNDGDLDCLVTNDGGNANELWINDGDGTFTRDLASPVVQGFGPHYGSPAGDYDNDGDVDLYIHGNDSTKGLYRNDLANGYGFLNLKLVGAGAPQSNVSAIGARVEALATIDGTPTWQMREVQAQNSFNAMNMLNVHFGLGNATVVDTVVVTWPAGGTTVLTDLAPSQFLQVNEASGTSAPAVGSAASRLALRVTPNPFASESAVSFALPAPGDVKLSVFDVAGRSVATLAQGRREAGAHRVTWDGRNASGGSVPSGVYFYRLDFGPESAVAKVVRID